MTGDLGLIQNSDLRSVFEFGTKFCENPILKTANLRAQFKDDIGKLITKICQKYKKSRRVFKDWKSCLLNNLTSKMMSCKHSNSYRYPVLSKIECKTELARLQDKYVITVVDKAAGNFAFTCKKFYFLKLAVELGLDNDIPGNETYQFVQDSETQVIDRIKSDLLGFSLVPEVKESRLALLYHIPKFHKNPPKMRYIAGNINTVMAKLDRIVARVMEMCKGHFSNLCRKNHEYSGVRYCFDVQTSTEVKGMFDLASGSARSISINDFATLYTLFDHDHMLGNVSWLLSKLSKNSGLHHVRVSHEKAWWVRGDSEGDVYTVGELLEMIGYLVRNTHVKAFGSIFRQTKGVIMGGASSGWLSDCSLMVDEFKYIDGKIKAGLREDADRLKFFCRYRDDCTTINVDDFLGISADIYPPSLSLTQENSDCLRADVLDMSVEIADGSITTKVYCKADSFPFRVISLPYLESNLDRAVCYRVFYGQMVRFQRLCTYREDFETRARFLLDILKDRGYSLSLLGRQFSRAIGKYISDFQKWEIPVSIEGWFRNIAGL